MVYALNRKNRDGALLVPARGFYSYSCDDAGRLYLTEEDSVGKDGRVLKCYRLHAKQPQSVRMALSYNVLCPRCSRKMETVDAAVSDRTLSLFTCRNCNRHEGGFHHER